MAEVNQAIVVERVSKQFDKTRALVNVSLKAERGKIFSLLGPNGAGKTTLIRILSTLILPDSGAARILGVDVVRKPEQVRRLIGLAGQHAAVDEFLTGHENIYMTGLLYGLNRREAKRRTQALLEKLDLVKAASRVVRTYSGGMRRRLDLGASLIGEPQLLFLDEPTTELDPKSRLDIWQIVRNLVANGTSILLTTQYLEEADELADHIAVLNEGKVIAEGTSNELKAKVGGDVVELGLEKIEDKDAILKAVAPLAKQTPSFDELSLSIRVPVKDGSKSLLAIVGALKEAKLSVGAISLHRPSLDDVFLTLTGHKTKAQVISAKKRGRKE